MTAETTVSLESKLDKTKSFPLPLVDSIQQWSSSGDLKREEEVLFDHIGLKPGSTVAPYKSESLDVPVGETEHGIFNINEFNVWNTGHESNDDHIVIVHGYGASKGFFYRNLKSIADMPNANVHALDWPGYGLSSRYPAKVTGDTAIDRLRSSEHWFLNYLEQWRIKRGIKKFKLIAHSLGAYLGTVYAINYPGIIDKLILVSPAGLQRAETSIPPEELYPNGECEDLAEPVNIVDRLPSWAIWLWEHNISPLSVVRNSFFLGPKLISGWTARRFAHLSVQEQMILQRYIYSLVKLPGSGEYFLSSILTPGATARWPLIERVKDLECETLFLYGENDWMDMKGGYDAVERMRKHGKRGECVLVKDCGHHIYLDNETEFNGLVHNFFFG